jgi:CDP-diacylglycerol---glycerol-3-phosphate 3-phosphatidyltransferase
VIDMRVRPHVQGVIQPIGRLLAALGVSPTILTVLGLATAVVGAVMIGMGLVASGATVALLGAAVDGLDGSVARASGRETARGAFLDATSDRVGEIAVFAGLAVSQAGSPRVLLLILLASGGSLLIPYLRAKAEAEGLNGKGGLMGRAERVILFSLGLITGLIEPMLWVMVVTTWLTVAQRFWSTYRAMDEVPVDVAGR